MQPLPEVTKNLLIINILMFIAQLTFVQVTAHLSLYTPGFASNFQPYQYVSYMFLHSPNDMTHLLFNMFALFMFGRDIEYALGAKKFLTFYLVTGIGAGLLHSGVQYFELTNLVNDYGIKEVERAANLMPTLGASGSIFGLLAAFAMLYPNRVIMLLFPPIPLKAKYFVLIYGVLELSMGVTGTGAGVAHFAHVGGAVVGFFLMLFWRKRGERF